MCGVLLNSMHSCGEKKKGKQRSSGVIVAQSTFSSSSEIMKNGGVQRVS